MQHLSYYLFFRTSGAKSWNGKCRIKCISALMHVCACLHTQAHVHDSHTHTHTQRCIYNAHIHTHTHTHVYTHTHTHMLACFCIYVWVWSFYILTGVCTILLIFGNAFGRQLDSYCSEAVNLKKTNAENYTRVRETGEMKKRERERERERERDGEKTMGQGTGVGVAVKLHHTQMNLSTSWRIFMISHQKTFLVWFLIVSSLQGV